MFRHLAKQGIVCAALALACLPGCSSDPPKNERPPLEGQRVRVLVVDDPAMASAVRDLAGTWKERSGALLTVEETTAAAVGKLTADRAQQLDADLVIYPSPLLGELADRQWLAPLDEKALADAELQWSDVFLALRAREATWGARTFAVPLGSRVLACFYRADLLKKSGKEPPQTWGEYQDLVRFFANQAKTAGAWMPAAEPLAEGSAGLMLLARAAAYARHRDYFTVLFNAQTMEPRIDGPPFVRALEELVAAVGAHHQTAGRLTPTDTLGELLAGRCALAIGWLPPAGYGLQASGTGNEAPKPEARSPKSVADVACVPLPGARESFDWDQKAYEPGALRRVPLLACEGRYASVTARAEHPAAARELLSALASGEWAVRASSPSAATTVFRGSQVEEAERWTSVDRSVATAYAKSVGESLDTQDVMYALRIPGREEYLAALDKAVRAAVSGRQEPQAVLTAAAAEWRAITGKLGVTSQRTACERSDVRIEH